jgi:SAM-dependent methyltransferase
LTAIMHERLSAERVAGTRGPLSASGPAAAHSDWLAVRPALIDLASLPYRRAGRFAYHFARGKLRGDPVFRALLERGLLHGRAHILDLGCGQGLLTAWLRAAVHCHERGIWPRGWPAPPRAQTVRGIELSAREVARARSALGAGCEVEQADIRSTAFGSADAVVLLDVLHYMSPDSQRDVLERVRAALPQDGLLLLRVGDAHGGMRFRLSRWTDQAIALARRRGPLRLHCRSVAEWRELLRACRFESGEEPMSHGTPFANVLLIARAS